MGKLWALLDVFRRGSAVTDPKLWKDRGAATIALTALLLALSKAARGFGYDLPVSEADAATLAAGIVAGVGLFVTYATSDKVGLPGLAPMPPKPGPDLPAGRPEPAEAGTDWKAVADRDFAAGKPDGPDYSAERGY